ncbi:MAG TPA: sigma-70 family RNA polymerase sigma factor [Synergistales bacterium]|jgi:RNA polymerase sigma factor (sigma-70 family)|nr:sigma-70 family RNA polymerase sigma factor [Synergistales bacterium]HRV72160.1 sigma-70 family RNA polymerase sigma factor [Thermovirgaceae bacterium]
MPEREHEEILTAFRPLVMATARRYCGNGAAFDDLVQEGYLAMLELLPRCKNRKYLAKYLKDRLPARVRTAARRAWRTNDSEEELDPETCKGCSFTPEIPWLQWVAEELLGSRDSQIVRLIAEGYTQKDIAETMLLTQQAVSHRVGQIRRVMNREIETRN